MKKLATSGLLALVCVALAATSIAAQQYSIEPARRAWLGLSYDATIRRQGDEVTHTIVVTDIVAGSPAQQAGLQAGDTLLHVNDIAVTDQLLSSLAVSLNPGDRVRLRIRRDGRERELDVEAASPPANYIGIAPRRGIVVFDSDSLRGRMSILMDSLRINLDSLRVPNLYIERLARGFGFGADSTFAMRVFPFDSFSVRMDTMMTRFHLFADSTFQRDTLRAWYFGPGDIDVRSFRLDSMRMLGGRWPGPGGDTAAWRRFDALPFAGISMFGARAIAGAELTELNPSLGEYFGTDHGILVVRVPDGTPAADAGLRAGDVIVGADGRDIEGIDELRRALLRAPAATVRLEVVRKRERIEIEFEHQ